MNRLLKVTVLASLLVTSSWAGEALSPDMRKKVDAKVASLKAWGSQAAVVKGVKDEAASPQTMTQDQWKSLTVIDPKVRAFTQNPTAAWLKSNKDAAVTEIFVNTAAGTKVAFLAKPTNWSHKGKPKHDVPMTGKSWVGDIEVDESTGQKQVQVAIPVLEGGKPIGSIVVGLSLSKL
jgi:hypothetical protein